MQHGFSPWSRKIPWRSKWQPTPVFLPGKFHGQTGLAGYSPGGCKSQTQLNDFTIQEHGLTLNLSSYLERWVLSSCSLSTTPRLPVCLGVEFSGVTGAPVFTSNGLDFVATAQGIILNCLALEAGGG